MAASPEARLVLTNKRLAIDEKVIPVIDLFAGPGGLGEGFSSVRTAGGKRRFDVKVSIEKDPVAHKTLALRAFFRAFPDGDAPDAYYDYIRSSISLAQLMQHGMCREPAQVAAQEARLAELGKTPATTIDKWISDALSGVDEWVLIGGPPCQAYSLAGRAKMGARTDFEADKRHFLYKEYLRIIRKFKPAIFVMENVRGILSSQHGGMLIFDRILEDLSAPAPGLHYKIRSFVSPMDDVASEDFIIRSELFGVPQRRHRVILFGVRSDIATARKTLSSTPEKYCLTPAPRPVSVDTAIGGLPPIRSRLSNRLTPSTSGAK